jgi:hypothetical protein
VSSCDVEELALVAIGEPMSPDLRAHVSSCVRCQTTLDELTSVASAAAAVTDGDRPVTPPAFIWENIERAIAADEANRNRGGARSGWFALAAAVGLIVGAGGTAVVINQDAAPAVTIVAETTLDPLTDASSGGIARVEQTAQGSVLNVSVPGLPSPDGYYEVWLLAPDASKMISIGVLGAGEQSVFPLPAGMQLADYPVVDVSLEKYDGDVTHSADSLVRGTLEV